MFGFSVWQLVLAGACCTLVLGYVRAAIRELKTSPDARVAIGAGIVAWMAVTGGLAVCVGVLFGKWSPAVVVFAVWAGLYAYIWARMFF